MIIETKRLILRPWEENDAAALFKYASDPDIGPIAGWPPHTSIENSLEIIRTVFSAPETYAVVLKETNEPVGSCGIMFSDSLHSAEMKRNEAEIGYWIGKPYWGQGLIPEAVKALLSRCFHDLALDTVWCGHYEGNTKSQRVIEKCGFKFHHTNIDIISPLEDKRTEHFYRMKKVEEQYVSPSERNDELLNRLASLWEASVRTTHRFLQEADIKKLKPYVIEGLANIRHLYIVFNTDAPVAFIGVQDEKIEMLFVSPGHLRKGIGKQLVDTAIKNHQTIFVDVNEQNPAARAFYTHLGFVEFGRTETDAQGNPFPIIEMRQKEFSLQTERLMVRSLQIRDTDMLYAFMRRKEVMYAWEHGFTKEEVREWINKQIYRYYAEGMGYWGIALRENSKVLIGQAGLMKTTICGNEVVEMGYLFDNTYWHNGYAIEAARHILSYAFDNLQLPAVYCSIRPENKASIRVAEKLGMKPYGCHTIVYRGKEMPHLLYKAENLN